MNLLAPKPITLTEKATALLYGRDLVMRAQLHRLMRTVSMYLVASLFLCIATLKGITPAWSSWIQVATTMTGSVALYALLRSGKSRTFADPSLAYAQLLFGVSMIVLSYTLIAVARGAALQLLCLILAFEMDRLTSRQLMRASLYTVVMLALSSAIRLVLQPGQSSASIELYNLAMAAVLLPTAIVVGGEVGRLYKRMVHQRQKLAQTLTKLNELSTQDALTGLSNRRHMVSLLEQEDRRQKRVDQPFAVAILDLDWFKQVNDSHGHAAGDQVLQQFSRLASAAAEPADVLARWGGEEFLLLMPASDEAQGLRILARIRDAIDAYDWAACAPGLRITFSAGVCVHEHGDKLETTLERADQALYRAKAQGRDQAVGSSQIGPVEPPPHRHAMAVPFDIAQPRMGCAPHPAVEEHVRHVAATSQSPGTAPSPDNSDAGFASVPVDERRWPQRLFDLVAGADMAMRDRLRLAWMAMATYAIWTGMFYWFAIPTGRMDPTIGGWLIDYCLFGMLIFYPLIRSGLTARWKDAELMLAQIIVGCSAAIVSYAAAPELRGSVLHLLCVIQIFGMAKLQPKASKFAGICAVLMMVATQCYLVLTGPATLDQLTETLKTAFACYIVWRLSRLSHDYAVVREKVAAEQEELEVAVTQVQELVIRDALTGLFNRKYMQDLLAHERERFGRTGYQFCVALIDLDHFKRVNDTYGHRIGDDVLKGFAQAAQATLRETDVICRWGGEEFLVMMRDTDPAVRGLRALTRLREAIGGLHPVAEVPDLSVTFSCGVTVARPGESLAPMLERADRALYAAKASGRNRCVMADGTVEQPDQPAQVMVAAT
jgi:diguanylate cyclase (GGDEF)-like protein